jgi:hypothetical protein
MNGYSEIATVASPICRIRISTGTENDPKNFKSALFNSSQAYLDLNFIGTSSNDSDDVIFFQNYYTSSITIIQLSLSTSKYTTVLENKQLMPTPYSEEGAQSWFSINFNELNSSFVKGRPIRIILNQPGPMWKTFEIRNLKVLRKVAAIPDANEHSFGVSNIDLRGTISEIIADDYKNLLNAFKCQIFAKDSISVDMAQRKPMTVIRKAKEKKKSDLKMSGL